MTKLFNFLATLVATLALAACGGGGGSSGTSSFSGGNGGGGSTGAAAASVDVVASAGTVGTGSSDVVTITATVKDASNVAIPSAPVTFSADTGTLLGATASTGTGGQASATLSAGSNKLNRIVTVTVTSGAVSGRVSVAVVSATAASVDVVASSNRAGTGGSAITITAVVKNSNNVTLVGAPIQFSSDTGNLVSSATATDANGAASARFSAGADRSNRTATITVVSGSVTSQLAVEIYGTTISVSGPSTLTLGASAPLSIKATDSTGAAVSGQSLSISGTLGNVPASTTVTTDSTGTASYTYNASAAGADTVTVSGAGVTAPTAINISGQNFAFLAPVPNAAVRVGTSQAVSVLYLVNGSRPANGVYSVRFTSTAGAVTPAVQALVAGQASVSVASPFAGPGTVQATVYAPASPDIAIAQASVTVQFVATTPERLILQVSPSAIGPNAAGATTQQAEVRAKVIDANFNPVAGLVVNFTKLSDTSGGNLLQASAVTDVNGIAKVQYVSGGGSTGAGGVRLSASVATSPAVSDTTLLSVTQNALFIALGQGNEITNVNPLVYQKQWTAYVTDSNGVPVPNVTLTVSALPTRYLKGVLVYDGTRWTSTTISDGGALPANGGGYDLFCNSEDATYLPSDSRWNNGFLDDVVEDYNGSGRLEPGNVISVNGAGGSPIIRTDANGFAIINLQYAESYAFWVEIDLKVAAIVNGTESSNTANFVVPGAASDYTNRAVPPAGVFSPFGTATSCRNPS